MAGFAGIVRLDGAPLDARLDPLLDAMGAAIAHRGLASRRVLRDGPFGVVLPADAPPGVAAAYDGRVAPEDLVALYQARGVDLVARLDGPFAFALWDHVRQRLVLARDRFGVRPLFVARAGRDTLLFGSEVKALLAHPGCPREVDWLAALTHDAMPRRTLGHTAYVVGVEAMAAGSMVIADVRAASYESRHWYAPPSADDAPDDDRADDAIIAGYRDLLARAVDDALGDDAHHTGLLLSGGIDSVSLAALAARQTKLPTFTVLGRSTLGNGDAALAHRAAEALGLDEHQVIFHHDEPVTADAWRRLVWLTETPACAFQHYYKFHLHRCAREVRPDLRVMLHGEGSDELSGADPRNQSDGDDEMTYDAYLDDLAVKQREAWHTVETLGVESWMGRPVFSREFLAERSGRPLSSPWARRVAYCLDGLAQDVLWREDRIAAGCGLASDAPYLNRRLVEYVLRIPSRAHRTLFWKKHMLREAMKGIVPDSLRHAPKIPFFGGVDARFTTGLLYRALMADDRALVREALGDGRGHPVLDDGLVDDLLDDLARDPQRNAVGILLTLTNLGLLERMARDAAARPGPAMAIPALRTVDVWDEAALAARLAPPRDPPDLDAVWSFAPNVYLVRPDVAGGDDAQSFIVVDDAVRFVLDGDDTRAWREVLRRVNGQRTLRSILDELGLTVDEVRKHADEAVDFGVLTVVS